MSSLPKATPLPKAPQKRIIRKPKTNVPAAAAVVPAAVPLVVPELLTTGALSEEEEEEEAEVPQSEDEENEEGEGDSDVGEEDAENSDIEKDVEEEEEEDEDKPAAAESEEEEEEEEEEEGPVGEEDEELISTTAAAKKKKNTKRSGAAATKGNRKMNKKNIDIGMLETDEELALGIQQQQNYPLDSSGEEEEDDDDDENGENYLQKFDNDLRTDFISNFHPEAKTHNYEEVKALTRLVRDGNGLINDPLHKTLPFMTKYEMTRVLGQRAKQIDSGAKPFVKVPLNIMDGYHIASLELEQKKLPFIIKRPLPNGGIEYWDISDLEIL